MQPYYEWNSKKEKFVKKPRPPRKSYTKVVYKLATNTDKHKILDFETECIKTEPDIYLHIPDFNDFKKRLKSIDFKKAKDFAVVLALVKGKVVGLLSMSWYYNYDMRCKVGLITDIWVLKSYRMAGIGTGLVNLAKKKFKKLDIKRIELIVGTKNLAAQEFYKKLGFKIRIIGQAILQI